MKILNYLGMRDVQFKSELELGNEITEQECGTFVDLMGTVNSEPVTLKIKSRKKTKELLCQSDTVMLVGLSYETHITPKFMKFMLYVNYRAAGYSDKDRPHNDYAFINTYKLGWK